ncbi:MAG: hypothetical protein M3Q48_09800 [Actinomycetota bacterium]|nr:hypothetical protein [Actinomycetota bacterium]
MTAWKRDEHLERLRKLKKEHPDRYEKLRPQDKLSLGYYEGERAKAEAAGVDVSAAS